jgi:nucleoside-diphosphate-sugar epimerase
MFKDKTLLITCGTGTFGNAVLHRFLETDVKDIRIFSRNEKKQDEVRDYDSILPAMRNVDLVFHAAALKQVLSCEFFPLEAIRTNAIGADNVMKAALACNVKNMIVLSTDKSVYPINAMGMFKALMEKLMIAKARAHGDEGTIFCGTRYGNVMASGLPIACSNRGPMPEVLRDAGVYFDPEKPTEIAEAIRKLIEYPALRTEKAEAAFERARAFTWERCADETFGFLAKCSQ